MHDLFHPARLARACKLIAIGLLGMASAAFAQNPIQSPAPSLRQALEAAWAVSPLSRSLGNRQAELDARQRATESLLASPPSLTLSHRTDRPNNNLGYREVEAEVALPLWNAGLRGATRQQVAAERNALGLQQASSKLKLAGELRELLASGTQAVLERDLAQRKREDARLLAQDVQRRVQAGDSPRIDALQAQAAERLAAVQVAQAQTALLHIQNQWHALTGLAQLALPESGAAAVVPVTPADLAAHPATASALAQVQAAQARLAQTEADRRDPLELGLGVRREQERTGESAQNSVLIALRIPFGGDSRNAPRLAAARAELDTAQAALDAALRLVQSEQASTQAGLAAARTAQVLAAERAALIQEAQMLIAKSYRLGESDLPTRLRLDAEKFEAELTLARASADTQRAIARFNQANGLLP